MRRGRIFTLLGVLLLVLIVAGALVIPRILGGGGGGQTAQGPTPTPTPTEALVSIVCVQQPIKRGEQITDGHLKMCPIPKSEFSPDTYFTSPVQVVGRSVYQDISPAGEPERLERKNVALLDGSEWALSIDPGMVAVSIPISRLSAISYAPRPGDHVDVIATLLLIDLDSDFQTVLPNLTAGVVSPGDVEYQAQAGAAGEVDQSTGTIKGNTTNVAAQVVGGGRSAVIGRTEIDPVLGLPFYVLPSEAQRPRMVSQAVLQNVKVLRVGNFPTEQDEKAQNAAGAPQTGAEPGAEPATGTQPGQTPPAQGTEQQQQPVVRPPDVITLIVSPQDAITLNYLIYAGAELNLALRSSVGSPEHPVDEIVPTQPVTLQYLMDTYNIPMPVKLPYGVEPAVKDLQAPELPNDKPLPTPTQ